MSAIEQIRKYLKAQQYKPAAPATESAIASLEGAKHLKLPTSYRAFLRAQDGWNGWIGLEEMFGTRFMLSDDYESYLSELERTVTQAHEKTLDRSKVLLIGGGEQPSYLFLNFSKTGRGGECEVVLVTNTDWSTYPSFASYLTELSKQTRALSKAAKVRPLLKIVPTDQPRLDPKKTSIDELDVGPGEYSVLKDLGLETLDQLLKVDPAALPPPEAQKIQAALKDLGITWGKPIQARPYEVPKERRVPRWTLFFDAKKSDKPVNRLGGVPNAWLETAEWPVCECGKPMVFLFQFIGKAAGGEIDLHGRAALQVFICRDTHFETLSACCLRSRPLSKTFAQAPSKTASFPSFVMRLERDFDDRIVDEESGGDSEELVFWRAFNHGLHDKILGLPVDGNPPRPQTCSVCKKRMGFLCQFSERVFDPDAWEPGTIFIHLCPSGHEAAFESKL